MCDIWIDERCVFFDECQIVVLFTRADGFLTIINLTIINPFCSHLGLIFVVKHVLNSIGNCESRGMLRLFFSYLRELSLSVVNIANAILSYGFVLLPICFEKDFISKSQKEAERNVGWFFICH